MPMEGNKVATLEDKDLKASLIEKLAPATPFQVTLSSLVVTLSFCRPKRRFAIRSISQSLKALSKAGFQLPLPIE